MSLSNVNLLMLPLRTQNGCNEETIKLNKEKLANTNAAQAISDCENSNHETVVDNTALNKNNFVMGSPMTNCD